METSDDVPQSEKTSLLFPHPGGATPTTVIPNSTQTTVPSSMAISKSEREILQVSHSERATKIPLRRDGTNYCFKSLKCRMCFSPIAPMEESTAEQHEGETGTGGGEATSMEDAGATGSLL